MSEDALDKKTLFICDLDNTITDSQLRTAFKEEGYQVNYIRINKSKFPGGLNTAFVNFLNEEHAKRALDTLNHLTLGKTELFINFASKKPTGKKFKYNPDLTVFVRNVPADIDTVILIKIFSSMFGEVTNLRIMRDNNNVSRGYGYITFKNAEDAQKAIDYNQQMKFEINGKKHEFNFSFEKYKSRENRREQWTNVYLRDFPETWNKEKLKEFAEKTGITKSVVSNYKKELELVYGFCNFASHDDALKFLELDQKEIYEDTMTPVEGEKDSSRKTFIPYINKHMSKDERKNRIRLLKQSSCCIFITNFGVDVKLNDINKEFSKFGKMFSSTLYEKPIHEILPGADTRYPRALVTYNEPEDATKALSMNNKDVIAGKKISKGLFVDAYKTRGGNVFTNNAQANHPVGNKYKKNNNYQGHSNYNNNNNHGRNNKYNNNNANNAANNAHANVNKNVENNQNNTAFNNNIASHGNQKFTIEDQFTQARPQAKGGNDYTEQIKTIVGDYLKENQPEHLEKLDKILDIFTMMFNEDEVQKCIDNHSHVAEYVKTIIENM